MTIPLNANALVTLALAKDFLDIQPSDTSQDDRVTTLINAMSDHIAMLTDRVLVSSDFTHYFAGDGSPQLLLYQFPVTAVSAVKIDRTWGFTGAALATAEYGIHRDVFLQRRYPAVWPTERRAIQVAYTAGFTTIPSDLQEATLLALSWLFDQRDQRRSGVVSRGKLGDTSGFDGKLPEPIMQLIQPYTREQYVARKLAEV